MNAPMQDQSLASSSGIRIRHRMPVVFGPSSGPRQGPDGLPFDWTDAPRSTASVSFLTDAERLSRLLPPGFRLEGDPVVTVEATTLTDLPWLAGRGYRMLGVKFGTRFDGKRDTAIGPFLAVLWENRPEPILTGREELGFAKLYAELPEPRQFSNVQHHQASWDGHTFLEMDLSELANTRPVSPPQPSADALSGTLHWRYLPALDPADADIEQAVLTPDGGFEVRYETFKRGKGTVRFLRSNWEQIPTMFHIVNALADLPILESRGATFSSTRGAKDLSDQRVLR
ncbi:Acetoacetate decarboxylase (ADC) [compost metagenome]